jgi:hypothetical protein
VCETARNAFCSIVEDKTPVSVLVFPSGTVDMPVDMASMESAVVVPLNLVGIDSYERGRCLNRVHQSKIPLYFGVARVCV